MKQMAFWFVFAAAVTALGLWPTKARDASGLLCAQVLVVDASKGEVTVEADCGVSGSGASLSEALEDMRAHAPGELFLDTAEHIVLRERAWYLLPQAASCRALRPAARLVRAGGELPGIEELRAFLQAHPEFELTPFLLPLPIGRCDGRLTLWPQRNGTDGFYICRMHRKD